MKDLSVTKNLHFTIQWVSSNYGLLGNEMADVLAKEATALDQAEAPIDQATAEALIYRRVKNTKYRSNGKTSFRPQKRSRSFKKRERSSNSERIEIALYLPITCIRSE
ncbi:hypothetical protein ElyMa_001011500 [Elysia marginata]|uniref:RNase H type-1 domain-containing protein n=1 Tax=Elysia marginata TaxID=1093978 RepID=A0AAV4HM74_9GAST|nr:hypothetical protein ElyMa_001011500 [Elysia marginata]